MNDRASQQLCLKSCTIILRYLDLDPRLSGILVFKIHSWAPSLGNEAKGPHVDEEEDGKDDCQEPEKPWSLASGGP